MKVILFLAAAALGFAQSPAAQQIVFPRNVFLAGALYTNTASPHYQGFMMDAALISPAAGTYSLTGLYVLPAPGGKMTTAITTGADQYMRSVKVFGFQVDLHALAGIGVKQSTSTTAVSSTTSLSTALNGGLAAVHTIGDSVRIAVVAQAINSTKTVGIAVGWGH